MGWIRDHFMSPAEQRAASSPDEERSVSVPWQPVVPFNVGPDRLSGTTGLGVEQALSLSPVFSAVRIIAQDVSTLPIKAYRKGGADRTPMPSLPALFQTRMDDGSLIPWLFQCVTSLALRGNAYGLVLSRDGYGYPTSIEWLNPQDVSHNGQPGQTVWYWKGRQLADGDLIRIRWFTLPGAVDGLSPIGAFARTMGIGLQSQSYQQDWFGSGGVPPGTYQNTAAEIVDQNVAEAAKARLVTAIRTRQPIVYGKDWQYTPILMPSNEAQFISTMQMTANQIAPIYGVRPEKIGGTAGSGLTYATVEQNQLEYVTSTLRFWCELLEGAFYAMLPQQQYVKFNMDAIVRADLLSRWNVHRMSRQIGAMNIDEIRALEDMPPLPDGEGTDYTPLHTVGNQEATISGPTATQPSPGEPAIPALPSNVSQLKKGANAK